MSWFKPKGERSRRAILIDLVEKAEPDQVLTYSELRLALDASNRAEVQSAVNGAKLSIERNTEKALVAIANRGYRVIRNDEHAGLALVHQKKSLRQVKRAKSKVDYVDLHGLSQDERTFIISSRVAYAYQLQTMRRSDARYAKREDLEKFMLESSRKSDRADEELARMKERISRLEKLGQAD